MEDLEFTEIIDLLSTRYVELNNIVSDLSKTLSIPASKVKEVLHAYDFASLRPLLLSRPPDEEIIKDCSNRDLTDTIKYRIGFFPDFYLTDLMEYYLDDDCGIFWQKPTLVHWCHQRKIKVPAEWDEWMVNIYPLLNDRGLICDLDHKEAEGLASQQLPLSKREIRKNKTHKMHQDWQHEYKKLKKNHANKSDVWIANCIAKLPIAKGRSPATIRKNMKTKNS